MPKRSHARREHVRGHAREFRAYAGLCGYDRCRLDLDLGGILHQCNDLDDAHSREFDNVTIGPAQTLEVGEGIPFST